jgi:hypothetical protein
MRRIGFIALGALLWLSAPIKAEVVVNISKSQQRLAVVVDGAEAYRWPISSGRRGFATPSGSFRPTRLERHWYSRQYNLTPMPWSVFFYRGYAVHGTMEAINLGRAVSHGCVRLRPDNAAILFALVRRNGFKNTKVVVMNGPLPAAPDARPMADAPQARPDSDEHFAKAIEDDDDTGVATTGARERRHVDGAERYRVSVSSDEAQVLRERQAWLRSLDRKYGITQ